MHHENLCISSSPRLSIYRALYQGLLEHLDSTAASCMQVQNHSLQCATRQSSSTSAVTMNPQDELQAVRVPSTTGPSANDLSRRDTRNMETVPTALSAVKPPGLSGVSNKRGSPVSALERRRRRWQTSSQRASR